MARAARADMLSEMERFEALLGEYGAAAGGAERQAVRRRMWEAFGTRCAVFVSDLSGFTRLTERHSIVHFLALIHECRSLLLPLIEQGGGAPVKTAADNMYAMFPDAVCAIETSIAMQRVLGAHNQGRPEEEQIGLCVGIGYGDVLLIGREDFYGHELNLAFKLGEDCAAAGEILATSAALEAAGPECFAHVPRTITVSGVTILHGAVRY